MENNKQDKKRKYKCCICNKWVKGYGNNPLPIKEKGKCCDECNAVFVIPARLNELARLDEL